MAPITKFSDSQSQIHDLNKQLSVIRKKLKKAEFLSLKEINHLSDRASEICITASKIVSVAKEILLSADIVLEGEAFLLHLEDLRRRKWEKDRDLLSNLSDIYQEIETLADSILFTDQENCYEYLASIYSRLKNFSDQNQNLSSKVKISLEHTFKKFSEVHFQFNYPLFEELREESYQENFIQKMKEISLAFIEDPKQAKLLFLNVSKEQRRWIYQAMSNMKNLNSLEKGAITFNDHSTSNFERARAIEDYLDTLKRLASIARSLIYEDPEKALFLLNKEDLSTQKQIDKLLSQIDNDDQRQEVELLVSVIIRVIEDRILG